MPPLDAPRNAPLDARQDADACVLSYLLRALHAFSIMFHNISHIFQTFPRMPLLDAPLDGRLEADARALSCLLKPFHTFSDMFKLSLTRTFGALLKTR